MVLTIYVGIWNMGIWEYGNMGIWEYGNMRIWEYEDYSTHISATAEPVYSLYPFAYTGHA